MYISCCSFSIWALLWYILFFFSVVLWFTLIFFLFSISKCSELNNCRTVITRTGAVRSYLCFPYPLSCFMLPEHTEVNHKTIPLLMFMLPSMFMLMCYVQHIEQSVQHIVDIKVLGSNMWNIMKASHIGFIIGLWHFWSCVKVVIFILFLVKVVILIRVYLVPLPVERLPWVFRLDLNWIIQD